MGAKEETQADMLNRNSKMVAVMLKWDRNIEFPITTSYSLPRGLVDPLDTFTK